MTQSSPSMSNKSKSLPSKTARLDTQQIGSGATSESEFSSSTIEMLVREELGTTIAARYRLTRLIGEGGMGVVYEAFDAQVERKVAIKLVRGDGGADSKFHTRFRRELEITSQLRHPSTIRVFEHGTTDDRRPYMVMELLTGISLAERLEQGRLPEIEALQYARQIAESLSEAHEHGIFHRDLKPDNIFIETVGVSKVIKVLDFGIAGGVDSARLTRAGEVFGTPQYMSPEQCNGLALDHRTDVYSLGCILYEAIEGRPPFSADSPMATMLKHVRAKVPPPRYCSKETWRMLVAALRKDPAKRLQTAAIFAERIGECIGAIRTQQKEPRVAPDPSGATALSSFITGPSPALGIASSASVPLVNDDDGRGRTIALVLAGAALLIVLTLLFGKFGGTPNASPSTPVEAPGETREVAVNLPFNRALVSPGIDGAAVRVDGEFQCETPCEIKVPVGDGRRHEIRVSKPGYVDLVEAWEPKTVGEPLPRMPRMQRE